MDLSARPTDDAAAALLWAAASSAQRSEVVAQCAPTSDVELPRLHSCQQSQFPPFPEAIDLAKANLA
jgi:hypothetical protein